MAGGSALVVVVVRRPRKEGPTVLNLTKHALRPTLLNCSQLPAVLVLRVGTLRLRGRELLDPRAARSLVRGDLVLQLRDPRQRVGQIVLVVVQHLLGRHARPKVRLPAAAFGEHIARLVRQTRTGVKFLGTQPFGGRRAGGADDDGEHDAEDDETGRSHLFAR